MEIMWKKGYCDLSAYPLASVDRRAFERLAPALEETLTSWHAQGLRRKPVPQAPDGDKDLLSVTIGAYERGTPDLPDSPEAYQLVITAGGLRIWARTPHGLFDGLQTLSQLVEQGGGKVPWAMIRDWPALRLRGIHLDWKGCMGPASYWKETIRLLSRFKINAVLIEYEDKFPYSSHPDIVAPGALTSDEIKALITTAHDHFVEVIPLLQCLGHVEYILRHPAYAALRENGDLTQLCPQNEGSLRLYRELAEEMIAAHPHSRRFHLGADETRHLGECPRCRAVVEEKGILGLFLGHLNQAMDCVREYGLQPIIWDDMIQRNLESDSLAALPEDVILCDWAYSVRSMHATSFYYGGGSSGRDRWASRRWLETDPSALPPKVRWLQDGPPRVKAFARDYWDRGKGPDYGSSLPWVRFFVDHGHTVLGASAAKGADGSEAFSPIYERRIENVATWARTAREDGAEGVISTAWSRYGGLNVPCECFEMGWYTYIASAAFYWEDRLVARDVFDRRFATRFLGKADSMVPRGIGWLDAGQATGEQQVLDAAIGAFESAAGSTTPHGERYMRYLALAARLAKVQTMADRGLSAAWKKSARASHELLGPQRYRWMLEPIEESAIEFEEWRALAAKVLPLTMNQPDSVEIVETQWCGYERQFALLQDFLNSVTTFGGDSQ
jgi:hexosaminidase